MLGIKVSVWVFLGLAIAIGSSYFVQDEAERNRDVSLQQLDDTDASARAARVDHWARNQAYAGAMACWAALGFVLFASDVRRVLRAAARSLAILALLLALPGCYRPFEPVHMETIGTSEEGFLIPYTGDGKKQASSNNEEYLKLYFPRLTSLSCRQGKQPLGDGPNFLLGDPGA